jgi:hypothetical protein
MMIPRPPRDSDRVHRENLLPGDPSWPLTNPADAHQVEGYGKRITLAPGGTLEVAVNVDKPKSVRWSLYRIGWYGGAGARKVVAGDPIMVAPQPACPRDPTTSRVECSWATAFTVNLPADALSGVWLIKLSSDDGFDWHVPLVIVDHRPADLLLNVDVTSWQAYNQYGGESLYFDASGTMPHGKAWEVSFDRPFAEGHGAGRFLQWEFHFERFVEALGYDVTYTTSFDLADDPMHAQMVSAFVSLANDEYWLPAARDAVENARNVGTNLAWLGGDQVYWRIRRESSSTGVADRVIACYKADQDKDPMLAALGSAYSTARFRDDPNARPENGLLGVMYNAWMLTPQPLVIANASSWVFAGTGLQNGDTIPSLVAFETDGRFANGVEPAGLQVLGDSPFVDAEMVPQRASMVTYTHASGAQVVGAATIGWPTGLGARGFADERVATMTRNVLDRFVGSGRKGDPDPPGAPWATRQAPSIQPLWAKSVSTVSSGCNSPAGVAVAANGTIYVADSWAFQIKTITPGGTVNVLAGDGVDGTTDGPGATARFRWPTGLALRSDGTLFVADSDNEVIRAIAPDAAHTVSTWAGMDARGGAFADGPGATARFDRPVALAFDLDGSLLVADMHNCRIRRVANDSAHTVSTVAGSILGAQDGPASQAQFNNPSGVAVASDGTIYVLDTYNRGLRKIATDAARTVSTLAGGDAGVFGLTDGPAKSATLGGQGGLALAGGRLYFSDVASERIRAFVLSSSTVATIAGSGRNALEDGGGAVAAFSAPLGLAPAPDGSLVIADSGAGAVRRLVP